MSTDQGSAATAPARLSDTASPTATHELLRDLVKLAPEPSHLHRVLALDTLWEPLHLDVHLRQHLFCLFELHFASPQRRLARLAALRGQRLVEVGGDGGEELGKVGRVGVEEVSHGGQ